MRPHPGQAVTCGSKAADAQRLQDLLRHLHLLGAVAAGFGGKGDADGVADALKQQRSQAGRRGDDALHAHPGFGKTQMQRVIAARSHQFINFDQVAHAAYLGAEDDLVVAQPVAFGRARGVDRAHQHRFDHHVARIRRLGPFGILVHHPGQQSLVQRTPVHADPHRLLVFDRALDHGAEVVIVLAADRDIARD